MNKVIAILLSVFVVWVLVRPMADSGIFDPKGNLLFSPGVTYYDAGVHLSLINEMKSRFPPTNFALGGIALKNYHYFYDAALAAVAKVTHLSVFDLYYRIGPVAVAALLCLAIYLAAYQLTKNPWAAAFAIFFTIMGTSLGAVTPYLAAISPFHPNGSGSGLFMTDQLYDWMVNPQGMLSLAIFLFLFFSLTIYQKTKKARYLLFFTLLLGLSFGVKAYGGVVFAAGALVAGLWYLKEQNFHPLLAVLAGLSLLGLWFLFSTDSSRVGLQFAPLWFLDRMMSDFEHLYLGNFPTLVNFYLAQGNWWHPLFLYLAAFLIYVIGSLGLRIVGLVPVFLAVKNFRRLPKVPPANMFLAGSGLASFAIPLFFNQSTKPYDIVQFLPYFTLLMGLSFTIVVFTLTAKLKKSFQIATVAVLVAVFLLLDKHEIEKRFVTIDPKDKVTLGAPLLTAIGQLQSQSPADSIILIAPTPANLGTLWFTSVSARRTVFSGEFFSYQVGANYLPIRDNVQKAFAGQPSKLSFDYLFLQAGERYYFDKISKQYRLREVFSNDAAVIYQRI